MPELPEVETVRGGLEPLLLGRRLVRVRIRDPRLTRPLPPPAVAARLSGRTVVAVRRRGKYLLLELDGACLLVHLRMTGGFRYWPSGRPDRDAYVRASLALDQGGVVTYRDVRRFGTWEVLDPDELEVYLAARLGPEPLGPAFTGRVFATALAGRRAPLKAALLDQRVVAGMGNIYADEALWQAGLHPLTPARELDAQEVALLRRTVRAALRRGIVRGGATLRDYRTALGEEGGMQDEFRVYGRAGEPCPRCGTVLERTRVAGRTTTFCRRCQPRRS